MLDILKRLEYDVSEETYMLGFAKKGTKTVLIVNIINGLKNKNIESMRAAYEKNKNENIKKQIDVLEKFKYMLNIKQLSPYVLSEEKKYKIVLSIQPRLIASQSTNVGWRSCMTLDTDNENPQLAERVGKGISDGVIIAYLTRTGDEQALNSPVARTLIKPLRNEDGEVAYAYDKVYGTAPSAFKTKVIEIIKRTGKYLFGKETKPGFYEIDATASYIDPDIGDILDDPETDSGVTIFSKEEKAILKKLNEGVS